MEFLPRKNLVVFNLAFAKLKDNLIITYLKGTSCVLRPQQTGQLFDSVERQETRRLPVNSNVEFNFCTLEAACVFSCCPDRQYGALL